MHRNQLQNLKNILLSIKKELKLLKYNFLLLLISWLSSSLKLPVFMDTEFECISFYHIFPYNLQGVIASVNIGEIKVRVFTFTRSEDISLLCCSSCSSFLRNWSLRFLSCSSNASSPPLSKQQQNHNSVNHATIHNIISLNAVHNLGYFWACLKLTSSLEVPSWHQTLAPSKVHENEHFQSETWQCQRLIF